MKDNVFLKVIGCGQGDCILIEWTDKGVRKMGLIDCNNHSVLDVQEKICTYLNESNVNELDFLVITHPHSDHYSGIPRLLKLFENMNITIKDFYHSFFYSAPYLDFTKAQIRNFAKFVHNNSSYRVKRFISLLASIKNAVNKGIIKREKLLSDSSILILNEAYKLKCNSPSTVELNSFITKEKLHLNNIDKTNSLSDEGYSNNPLVNLLSISLSILNSSNKKVCFLTADSESETFNRLNECSEFNSFIAEKSIPLFQIPHHGSSKNFNEKFWNELDLSKSCSFISVGKNQWGHPDESVVSFFNERTYNCYLTMERSDKIVDFDNSIKLSDGFRTKHHYETVKDLNFKLSENNCEFIT